MDIFTTGVLRRVVAELPPPQPFILNSFFAQEQRETGEEIHFDVDTGRRRIAPFVSPIVAGQVVASRGFRTDTFKPAYIKDKRVFDGNRPLKRAMGERIGGELSPAARMQAIMASELQDQLDMLTRRMEVMAVEALRTGNIDPKSVVHLNAHATSTPVGDIAECKAIHSAFDDQIDHIAVSATKSMTGHLLGAAGSLEAIFTIKAIQERLAPAQINLFDKDPEIDLDIVHGEPRTLPDGDIVALDNSFGFGGCNVALAFGNVR